MKYFKFTQISGETGISWVIAQPASGPCYPPLPGLNNIIQLNYAPLYYIGEASDDAVPNPDNHCYEISFEERALELKKIVDVEIARTLDRIYDEEKEARRFIFNKYDESAVIAGVYKYQEAKQLLQDAQAAAPNIRQEASVRGLDVLVLANRIVSNHEAFQSKEAKISGIRGKMLDRLNNFVFDLNNPDVSYNEFFSAEKIGEREIDKFEEGQVVQTTEDVKVGKYHLSFGERFNYST